MQVVWKTQNDAVDIVAFQQLAVIGVRVRNAALVRKRLRLPRRRRCHGDAPRTADMLERFRVYVRDEP
jgi:hypothetical protein